MAQTRFLPAAGLILALAACSSAYYKTMEGFGIERETARLIAEMQKAIDEADAFIQSFK